MINWQNIDTVLLDMDGTILDLSFDNFFWLEFLPEVYAQRNNISLTESKTYLSKSYGEVRGELIWYCLDHWSKQLDLDIPALKKSQSHRVKFREQALAFLQFLRQQEKRVILVTNAHPKSLEIKMLETQFHQYFCELNSSHHFGVPKELQAYWFCLNDKYPFDPSRTLFIDDSPSILKAAQRYGIKYLLGIKQPDSTKPPVTDTQFPLISQFNELMVEAK